MINENKSHTDEAKYPFISFFFTGERTLLVSYWLRVKVGDCIVVVWIAAAAAVLVKQYLPNQVMLASQAPSNILEYRFRKFVTFCSQLSFD
jgi:hypothetical protein